MTVSRTLHTPLLATAVAALLLTTGCANTPPIVDKMHINPMGTVLTYHRKSSGSLGNFDGPVVWTQTPATWQGKQVLASGAPQAGVGIHDLNSMATIANLTPAGQPLMSFEPPIDYPWPLQVGKTWSAQHTVTLYPSGNKVPLKIDGKVESWGDVTVPAGTFKAYKLMWTNSLGEMETRWTNPAEGLATIKRHVERPATHPQGAGVLDADLLSRALPAR